MTMAEGVGDSTTPDEIRAALQRMTVSDVFARSPQLGAFLRFVIEAVLHGRAERIKAYTIGVEVLRRDSKFDPQLDPIVRVEATRLRRAIERYYVGPGAADDIIIDLPRGSYVPTFRRREILKKAALSNWLAMASRAGLVAHPPSAPALGVAAAIAIAAVAGATFYGWERVRSAEAVEASRSLDSQTVSVLPPGNGMPTIAIEPLRVIGTRPPGGVAAERLYARISDAFTRFDTINVASAPFTAGSGAESQPLDIQANYRLAGSVEYADSGTNAWFTLTSTAENKVVWSRTFDHVSEGAAEDGIVIALTNSLLQSYGVIRARDRASQLASNNGDPRYRCVLQAADAIRTADRETHDHARACLEHLTALDPGFAVGFTFLAMIYNREYQLGYAAKPGDSPPLERALRAARQAIALHPEDSRPYLALLVVQSNRRDTAAALAAGDKCLSLNKYDMLALGEYGGRLILAGQVDKGMAMLREAGAHGAMRPAWHHIYMFVGNYVSGDMAAATRNADDIPGDNVALGLVARALTANAAGNQADAQKAVEQLAALGPGWRRNSRAELARLIASPEIVDRLARDLASAGLSGGS